jgi:hypothetical protein
MEGRCRENSCIKRITVREERRSVLHDFARRATYLDPSLFLQSKPGLSERSAEESLDDSGSRHLLLLYVVWTNLAGANRIGVTCYAAAPPRGLGIAADSASDEVSF